MAEDLSFGDAAKRLHITQPSLSLQIQSLKQIIGSVLFVRRPNVRLTKAGKALREKLVNSDKSEAFLETVTMVDPAFLDMFDFHTE